MMSVSVQKAIDLNGSGETIQDAVSEALDRARLSVEGSRQIIDHLAALGHRRIGYLAGPRESWTDDERWRALTVAADLAGIEIVRHGPFLPTLEQGFAAADVGLGSGVSAMIAFNDLLAIGALQRLERRGVDVPAR